MLPNIALVCKIQIGSRGRQWAAESSTSVVAPRDLVHNKSTALQSETEHAKWHVGRPAVLQSEGLSVTYEKSCSKPTPTRDRAQA